MRALAAAAMAVSSILMSGAMVRAEPRSAKECASIEESFAYNECIAKFGPSGQGKIVSHTAGPVIATAPAAAPVESGPPRPSIAPPPPRPAAVAPARAGGLVYQRRANGRYFATFAVGRSTAPAPRPASPAAAKGKSTVAAYSRWRQYRRH